MCGVSISACRHQPQLCAGSRPPPASDSAPGNRHYSVLSHQDGICSVPHIIIGPWKSAQVSITPLRWSMSSVARSSRIFLDHRGLWATGTPKSPFQNRIEHSVFWTSKGPEKNNFQKDRGKNDCVFFAGGLPPPCHRGRVIDCCSAASPNSPSLIPSRPSLSPLLGLPPGVRSGPRRALLHLSRPYQASKRPW